jgi:Tol biopolymer transport system component
LFLRDRLLQTTELLTRPFAGGTPTEPMTLDVFPPAVFVDGRYVAFASSSRELLPVDPSVVPLAQQVYVLDRQLDRLERVSVTADGAPGNQYSGTVDLSDDGRWLAFYSQANNLPAGGPAIYVVDRWGGQWLEVTAALGPTLFGTVNLDLASDGSTIAFSWAASRPELPGFGRLNIYTVDLQGLPSTPPREVATLDRTATLLLLALLALTGLRRLARGDGWPSGRRLATRG